MIGRHTLAALLIGSLAGCSSFWNTSPIDPKSQGEQHASYTYIPLDPLPVDTSWGADCYTRPDGAEPKFKELLRSLPDQAVRIAVGQFDTNGTLVFGPVRTGVQGHSYQIVLDYIGVDASYVPLLIDRKGQDQTGRWDSRVSVFDTAYDKPTQYRVSADTQAAPAGTASPVAASYKPDTKSSSGDPKSNFFRLVEKEQADTGADHVVVPVYVGVGLRLTASVTVKKGTANLSSLGAISAAAEAGTLSGSLVVQTLGITGKSISTTLPLPSELNQTTIQNAILALGSIKAVLYDPNTEITPRVVGIYNPVGGGAPVVNGIISVLSRNPILWKRPCEPGPAEPRRPVALGDKPQ